MNKNYYWPDAFFEDVFGMKRVKKEFPVTAIGREDGFRFYASLAGMKKEDIEVSIDNSILTISAKREIKEEGTAHVNEIVNGEFERSFELPKDIDRDSVVADYKDGILMVDVKYSEKAKPKTIKIK